MRHIEKFLADVIGFCHDTFMAYPRAIGLLIILGIVYLFVLVAPK